MTFSPIETSDASVKAPIKTIEEVWQSNRMTRDEVARYFPAPATGPRRVEAPKRVLREADGFRDLPDGLVDWGNDNPANRPWLVILGPDAHYAEVVAAATLAKARRACPSETAALRRVSDLLAEHDEAPRYGPGNGGSVMASWTRIDVLALSGIGRGNPTARAAPLLADLLERRLDSCRCTVVVETEPGKAWLGGLARQGVAPEILERIKAVIATGTERRSPIAINPIG